MDDPASVRRIRSAVASGQWETIGGMWVEPDTNMPSGESLARQILYGQGYFERAFGVRHSVCWLPDCFGFSPALPQLLRQGGIDRFLTIKVNWSETNRFPHDLFWWEGLDGTRVLAHTFDNPIEGYNGDGAAGLRRADLGEFPRQDARIARSLLAVGYGDGGGGPTPEMVERERSCATCPPCPARAGGASTTSSPARTRAPPRPKRAGVVRRDLSRIAPCDANDPERRQAQAIAAPKRR